ncbi:MAG: PRC-barrel domain-containing protein, partial [Pseudomonadota bacterium]
EGEGTTDMSDPAMLIRTRDITGGEIYTMDAAADEWVAGFMHEEVSADWNQIGTIEDIVLDQSGQVVGIIAEIGGFLDIGDKHVMLSVDDLNLVAVDDVRYTYVTRHSEEDLENMEGVDEGFWN